MRKPERRFLTAEWRHLLMLNYEVAPVLLRPFIPAGTELDTHAGRAYVSLVAFRFCNTRLLGVPIPFHRNFEELNLRFYVRRTVQGAPRRAVVFIREVVPRFGIAAAARAIYNEPYVTLPMRSQVAGDPPAVQYEWLLRGKWQGIRATAVGAAALAPAGSLEEFITDHAWGYTRQRDGGTIEYRVDHEPWRVWPTRDIGVDADFAALYGAPFGAALREPASALLAAGSAVTVYAPVRLDDAAAA